jgi:ankyrin repeat protein
MREALRYDPDDSECQRALDQLVEDYAETDAASEVDPLTRRISHGIDAVPVDEYGAYTIHHAARRGDATAVEAALGSGIDVDVRDDDGETPLHWAAASSGTEGVVELLLRHGADADARSRAYGRTPLHSAAQFGNADAARVLLSAGASADVRDVGHATPYDVAQSVSNRELAEILGKARGQ